MATRAAHVTQADIARALKAAQAAGLTVAEFITTKDGVRVVTAEGSGSTAAANPWDRFLDDGKAQ